MGDADIVWPVCEREPIGVYIFVTVLAGRRLNGTAGGFRCREHTVLFLCPLFHCINTVRRLRGSSNLINKNTIITVNKSGPGSKLNNGVGGILFGRPRIILGST